MHAARSKHRGHSRWRLIVDWRLQGALIAHVLLHGGLVLVAIVGGIFAPLLWNLAGEQPSHFDEEAIVMLYLHERFWFLALVCAGIVVLSAMKLSHRIAGPLVRYKRNLRLLADGRLPPPLRTRDGDYLQQEVACLNAAVAGVGARVDTIRRAQRALQARLDELLAAPATPVAREAVADASRELDRAVAAFTAYDPGDDRPAAAAVAAAVALAGNGDPLS